MSEFFLYVYVCALGFGLAGLVASLERVVTGQPMRFSIDREQNVSSILIDIGMRVMAGPFLLVRNSVRCALTETIPASWLAIFVVIATVWSFFTGVLVVELLFRLSN